MAELSQQDVVDYIKGMSVLEVSEMVKKLEDELGVQAAASPPATALSAATGMALKRRPSSTSS